MTLRNRRILAAAFILIFFVTAPILVMHTAGFRLNFKKWSWQKTGSIFIETEPKDAEIFVDGKKIESKTPAIINALHPNIYSLKIAKKEFHPWERNIEVIPERTTIIKDIILLPQDIRKENEAAYSKNDSPVIKKKEGSFVYAENFWKFKLETNDLKNDYILDENQIDGEKIMSSTKHKTSVSAIPKEAREILDTDGSSFVIFKDGQNGLIIGSIIANIFEKKDYLRNVADFVWDEKNLILEVCSDLELLRYKMDKQPIEKNLIIRTSSGIDRLLPLPNSIYTAILQKQQIKIVENSPFGTQIIPIFDLESDEKLIYWETNKKFNISIWTQHEETLRYFELALIK